MDTLKQEVNKEKHWSHVPPREFKSMNSQEYIMERINAFREWYDKKAGTAKKSYLYMRTISVLGGVVVPVLINLSDKEWMKMVTSLISLVVVSLISLESVYHFREQWKNYRATEQLLAKEYYNFSTGEGPYRKMKKEDAFLILVERVENAIESENASTLNVMTTVTESKTSGDKTVANSGDQ